VTPHGEWPLGDRLASGDFDLRSLFEHGIRHVPRVPVAAGRTRAVARGQKMGRPLKFTDHQKREAIKRRNEGETLADIARSYNVSPATISRLEASDR
jgi:DNA invertase Pin-like site-specific DNA recombinase